ncbi:MAG: ABC transporter substrate-binding protein, partial [Alphaproteobacteria bacterium]|nr:ABC transporter substrate-binding protein [Alphaproteobacteria bacterium]
EMLKASQGFDLPLYPRWYTTNDVWEQATPPDGVLHNYPIHGDEVQMVPGIPAPPPMATQIFTQGLFPNLVARVTQRGQSIDDAISWAENELEGYMRG